MKRVISVILSLTAIAGLALQPGDSGWTMAEPRSFMFLPVFLVLFFAIERVLKIQNTRMKVFSAIPAAILSICHLLGSILVKKDTALWLLHDHTTLIPGFISFAGYGIVLFVIIVYALSFLTAREAKAEEHSPFIRFWILWLIIAAAWLPWLLNQYPGVMTADTTDQIEMALGVEPLNNHHPILHTLLLRVFLKLGATMDPLNPNQTGAALFTIAQFLLISAVFASVLLMLLRGKRSRIFKACVTLFFLFYPVHPLYSVTIWKDVPFSACLLAFTALLYCELKSHKKLYIFGITVSGILMTLFRHNGIYLILLSLPFLFTAFRNNRKAILLSYITIILFSFGWNRILITNILHIPSGRASEAFSIPLQQAALTAKRHHKTMDPAMLEELQRYFDVPEIWERYTFRISDPVKNNFNESRYGSDPIAFWKFWLRLGAAYPQDYLDGLLLHTYGYWYPETPHWVFITGIDDNGLFGIHMDPKLDTGWARSGVQWLSDSGYDRIPLLSLLFSPGACFWLILILFCGSLYRRSSFSFLYAAPFILWLTALASPVNCEFRYVYPLFLCLPILITAGFSQKNESE